jgi:anti-anti-sigma factor
VVVGAELAIDFETLAEGVVVVHVAGEIDMATTPAFVERLLPVAETGTGDLVVDLTGVTFMGAAGLHALEELQSSLRRRDARLAVVAPGGVPLRLLKLTRLARALGVVPTLDAARVALGGRS